MNHTFPVTEFFPDEELAPLTAESIRYRYQSERLNKIANELRELDASLAAKIGVATALIEGGNSRVAETCRALEGHDKALEEVRARQDKLTAAVNALAEAVKHLDARLPDPKQVRLEILGDLWRAFDGNLLDRVDEIRILLETTVLKATANFVEATSRGFICPELPAEGASLLAQVAFRQRRIAFRIRKFAADWFMATQMVGVSVVVLLFVMLALHAHF
jgi:hypothetical protein